MSDGCVRGSRERAIRTPRDAWGPTLIDDAGALWAYPECWWLATPKADCGQCGAPRTGTPFCPGCWCRVALDPVQGAVVSAPPAAASSVPPSPTILDPAVHSTAQTPVVPAVVSPINAGTAVNTPPAGTPTVVVSTTSPEPPHQRSDRPSLAYSCRSRRRRGAHRSGHRHHLRIDEELSFWTHLQPAGDDLPQADPDRQFRKMSYVVALLSPGGNATGSRPCHHLHRSRHQERAAEPRRTQANGLGPSARHPTRCGVDQRAELAPNHVSGACEHRKRPAIAALGDRPRRAKQVGRRRLDHQSGGGTHSLRPPRSSRSLLRPTRPPRPTSRI